MTDYYQEALDLFEFSRDLRRDFHRHPELGFQEVRTAGIVARELQSLGLEVSTGVGKTGVVAMLDCDRPGPVVMLRFDMDALPILEETGAEYASQTPGVMHACGHDGHVAVGLTVARLLHAHRSELAGSAKLVFQPAEEGLGGAELMVAEGVLNNPRPDVALGLHLWNEKPIGWVGAASGPVMAASETFDIKIYGRGGHGAVPHLAVDPVLAAAQVVTALQSIISRSVSPLDTAVISVTSVKGGEAFNVIPSTVDMKGTIRTFRPQVRSMVLERFHSIVEGVARAMGCQVEIQITSITPAVINDSQITELICKTCTNLFPEVELDREATTMGSEDMAFFLREVPGCFFFVGSTNKEKGLDAAHHHPRFDFDEQALPRAAGLMAAAAAELLKG
jgi:amidohydrolase